VTGKLFDLAWKHPAMFVHLPAIHHQELFAHHGLASVSIT
jgi:hypothetical protein